MIVVEKLVYEYPGKRALNHVDFTIPEGSITALVGPNGAGKTTLLRCMAALDEPFSGTVQVGGLNAADHPRKVHQMLGYLADNFGLYDDLTVRQCLTFMARIHQLTGVQLADNLAWVVELMGLEPYLDKKAGVLSRGWRQRLGMAQAMIHRPKLLLLDEPASGLDPESRMQLSSVFRGLQAQGVTLVVSSHILAELEDYCTDMLVLREGNVVGHQASAAGAQPSRCIVITLLESHAACLTLLQEQPHVQKVESKNEALHIEFVGDEQDQATLLAMLVGKGIKITSFAAHTVQLQDVYLALAEGKAS